MANDLLAPGSEFEGLKKRRHNFAQALVFETFGDAKQAAIIAGIPEDQASQRAYVWKREPLTARYIQYLKDLQLEENKDRSARVISELEKVAFANIGDLVEWHGSSEILNPDFESETDFQIRKSIAEATGEPEPARDPKTIYPTIKVREGVTIKDSTKVGRALKAAVQAVSITPTEFGNKVNIQMHGKTAALTALVGILGINAPKKIESTSNLEVTKYSIRKRGPKN